MTKTQAEFFRNLVFKKYTDEEIISEALVAIQGKSGLTKKNREIIIQVGKILYGDRLKAAWQAWKKGRK